MTIADFALERYFAKHEFSAKYMFSSSDCDGFPMEYILNCADSEEKKLWNNLTLGYTESYGSPTLRESIATQYQTISADNVVVASPGELNFITMNLLVKEGDHAIVISPSYQSLSEVIRATGAEISFWKPSNSTIESDSTDEAKSRNSWKYDIDELEALVQPNTKLIVINFPLNPTGSYLSPKELERVVEIAENHNLWLFSDEMYRDLLLDNNVTPLTPVCDLYEKGISLWGMAKSFGLAGLRIGWLASRNKEFLQRVVSYKDYLSICCSAPSEVLATIAINHKEQFIAPNIAKIKKNLSLFTNFVESHINQEIIIKGANEEAKRKGLDRFSFKRFSAPIAGSVAFVPISYSGTSLQFSDTLVEAAGIMTVPAEMFDYHGNYLRIGFGRENFSEVLRLLATLQ